MPRLTTTRAIIRESHSFLSAHPHSVIHLLLQRQQKAPSSGAFVKRMMGLEPHDLLHGKD